MTEKKRFIVKKEYLVILAATFFFALCAHGFAMFQKLSVLDDPVYLFDVGATYTSGRWMLYLLYRLTRFAGYSAYSLPLFNSLVSFFLLAVVSCVLCELFGIKRTWVLIAVSGILTVSPAVTGLMAYPYTMPYYFFGLLLCVFGAALSAAKKTWPCLIGGIVLICCGIGIYQSYLPFAMGVLLIYGMLQLADGELSGAKGILREAVRLILIAAAALVLYLLVNKAVLSLMNAQMSDYRSLDSFGRTDIGGYLARLADAYKQFFLADAGASYQMYPMRTAWLFFLTVPVVIAAGVRIAKRLAVRVKADAVFFLVFLLLSPLLFHFIFVITGKEEVHSLMVHSHVLWFFMAAAFLERWSGNEAHTAADAGAESVPLHGRLPLYTAFTVLTLALCLGLTRYANVCYQAAHYAQSEAVQYLNRLALKIEQLPGYTDGTEIAFIGEYEKTAETLPSYEAFQAIVTFPWPRDAEELLNQYTWKLMMDQWCGFLPHAADPSPFADLPQVQAMPCYPADGSIVEIDGTVVVKFADSAASGD